MQAYRADIYFFHTQDLNNFKKCCWKAMFNFFESGS